MTRKTSQALTLAILFAVPSGPASLDAAEPPAPPSAPAAAREPVASSALFAFWSDADLNLHHFLYQWARSTAAKGDGGVVQVPEKGRLGELSAEEKAAWEKALAVYREKLVERSLLFDKDLKALRDAVVGKRAAAGLAASGPEALAALDSVRPIYRRHFWAAHDAANRRWIEAVLPLALRHEKTIAPRLTQALGGTWPAGPIRVDVSAYANDLGAYTTPEPHATVDSTDPHNGGSWALEVIFHETSHAQALEGALWDGLAAAFPGGRVPRNLTHVFIFHTVGELTRQVLAATGTRDYVPYAELGLYQKIPSWGAMRETLIRHWQPYLEGKAEREAALKAVVAELAAGAPASPPRPAEPVAPAAPPG